MKKVHMSINLLYNEFHFLEVFLYTLYDLCFHTLATENLNH